MNKSITFCKTVSTNPNRSDFTDRDWTDEKSIIHTVSANDFFDKYIHGNRKFRIDGTDERGNQLSFHVCIDFSQNADFQYFTSDSCLHDGTILFPLEMIEKIVRRVCFGETYYKKLDTPKSGDTLRYTVGDFVILNEYSDDFATDEKPWLRERTTVMLPIRQELR